MNKMPKVVIDYSNTIIYKITCKNPAVKDLYVGHTTNFVQRKHAHKNTCSNEKSSKYNCKLYQAIRNNGGWNNWTMEIINFFNCKDHYDARKKEQEYFELLNATLNSIEPMPKPKRYLSISKNNFNLKVSSLENKNHQKFTPKKFICDKCCYSTTNKSNYNKHISSQKHLNIDKNLIKENVCNKCNKSFATYSGLYKHKKLCEILDNTNSCSKIQENNVLSNQFREPDNKKTEVTIDLVLDLIKQNKELQTILIEQNKEHNKQILELMKNQNVTNSNL